MKFNLLLLLLFFSFLLSLPSSAQKEKMPERFYVLLADKEIIQDTSSSDSEIRYTLSEGDYLIFNFRRQTKKFDQTIAYDVGLREDFYFQIPGGVEEFELRDEELSEAMAFSQTFCRCVPRWIFYNKGTIRGKKIDENEWKVEIEVSGHSPQEEDRTFTIQTSGTFRQE